MLHAVFNVITASDFSIRIGKCMQFMLYILSFCFSVANMVGFNFFSSSPCAH